MLKKGVEHVGQAFDGFVIYRLWSQILGYRDEGVENGLAQHNGRTGRLVQHDPLSVELDDLVRGVPFLGQMLVIDFTVDGPPALGVFTKERIRLPQVVAVERDQTPKIRAHLRLQVLFNRRQEIGLIRPEQSHQYERGNVLPGVPV